MKTSIKVLMLLLACGFFSTETMAATTPVAQNTKLTLGFDQASMIPGVVIWDKLPVGYDEKNPQKWGRNSLVCQSRTDAEYGACLSAPVWAEASVRPTKIKLNFTLAGTSTVAALVVEGRKSGSECNNNGSAEAYGPCEASVSFSISTEELKKLSPTGRWTATLKQNAKTAGDYTGKLRIIYTITTRQ